MNQYDSYPSVGYQKETYVVCEEDWYPPSGYKNGVPGMQMQTCPSITAAMPPNHHMMAEGGYGKPHHNEWDGKSHDHQKHGYNTGHGGYAQPHEGWTGKNKHHTDWSGKPDPYSHGYNSHGGGGAAYGVPYNEGYGPAMQGVGYGYGSAYEGQCPSKHYEKVEYWGVKDVKD